MFCCEGGRFFFKIFSIIVDIMLKLNSHDYPHITESILKALFQNRITTVLDFLQEDPEKLTILTKLSLPQILEIRENILKKHSAPLINGTSLLVRSAISPRYLSTGIQSLDSFLGGGLPVGFITELCGLSDSGKTQLCHQLSINCVKNSNSTVLYVDTKGDFSATRIQKILDACGCSHKEMAMIMFKIKIVYRWTMEELLELFKILKTKALQFENLKLIIIDSLPCLMFQFLGDNNKVGLSFLNTFVSFSRYLCKEFSLSIICVNIQTRWVEQDVTDIDDEAEQTIPKESYKETRNRCLGKYWQNIPKLVLITEKCNESRNSDNLTQTITITKSDDLKCLKKCTLHISDLGVTQ